MSNLNTMLKGLFNPQVQINQGEMIPPERQVSEEDIAQVPQVVGSPEGRYAISEVLKAGSIPVGFVNPLVGAGVYAAGTAIDPTMTTAQKLSPQEIGTQGVMLAMGSIGKGAKFTGGLSDELAKLARNNRLSQAEVEILLERSGGQPVKQAMRSIPTAVERHLDDAVKSDALDWRTRSAEKGFEMLKAEKGATLTPEDIMSYWKDVK